MRHLDLVGLQLHGGTNKVITITMLAWWFFLSTILFALMASVLGKLMDDSRSTNTWVMFASQAMAGLLLSLLNAVYS